MFFPSKYGKHTNQQMLVIRVAFKAFICYCNMFLNCLKFGAFLGKYWFDYWFTCISANNSFINFNQLDSPSLGIRVISITIASMSCLCVPASKIWIGMPLMFRWALSSKAHLNINSLNIKMGTLQQWRGHIFISFILIAASKK